MNDAYFSFNRTIDLLYGLSYCINRDNNTLKPYHPAENTPIVNDFYSLYKKQCNVSKNEILALGDCQIIPYNKNMSAIEGIRSPNANPEEDIESSNEKAGETTWNDVADLKDQMEQLEAPVNGQLESSSSQALRNENIADARGQLLEVYSKSNPTEDINAKRIAAVKRIEAMKLSDRELINITSNWNSVEIDQTALSESTQKNGNPNSYGDKGLSFSDGNLPMKDESIYRHVGTSAIADLAKVGYVRNKRETADALDIPGKKGFGTSGATVYWNSGDSRINESADLVIEANKAAADIGYVTKDDVLGIWVTDSNTGEPVNLIDGKDHTNLSIADHRE